MELTYPLYHAVSDVHCVHLRACAYEEPNKIIATFLPIGRKLISFDVIHKNILKLTLRFLDEFSCNLPLQYKCPYCNKFFFSSKMTVTQLIWRQCRGRPKWVCGGCSKNDNFLCRQCQVISYMIIYLMHIF